MNEQLELIQFFLPSAKVFSSIDQVFLWFALKTITFFSLIELADFFSIDKLDFMPRHQQFLKESVLILSTEQFRKVKKRRKKTFQKLFNLWTFNIRHEGERNEQHKFIRS